MTITDSATTVTTEGLSESFMGCQMNGACRPSQLSARTKWFLSGVIVYIAVLCGSFTVPLIGGMLRADRDLTFSEMWAHAARGRKTPEDMRRAERALALSNAIHVALVAFCAASVGLAAYCVVVAVVASDDAAHPGRQRRLPASRGRIIDDGDEEDLPSVIMTEPPPPSRKSR